MHILDIKPTRGFSSGNIINNIIFNLTIFLISYLILQFSNLKSNDVSSIQSLLEECLENIRPNAVGLVDSFDMRDDILGSALGVYDGNVYERLLDEAMKSPLNKEPVNESFHKYLKPFLKSNL